MSAEGPRRTLRFHVHGRPAPQGSKDVRNGYAVESNPRSRPWRRKVEDAAVQADTENWLYATNLGRRPLIRVVGASCQSVPPWSSSRSR
jgi:hypothetical protein